ncbi:hypothetical protein V6N11_033939 [Hibiscus sabdariffa]|uniref:Zinc beta-ribbon domain-containing protein n=1 Tax=Hibiscus sabdariffa TaxID=183260 RepID=A0ABR2S1R3_9ROSI
MDDETKEMEDAVSESSGHHEAKVKGVVDDSAQWVPTFVVEPVPEIIKSILVESTQSTTAKNSATANWMLLMQPPKETETPQKETLAQLTQPLFETSPRSSSGDGNAALEGGQFSLRSIGWIQTNRSDRASMDEPGSWMSQLNQTVNASSSLFNQTQQTQPGPIDHTTTPPPPTDHCQIETAEVTREAPTFWTACPYCYTLYEYPKVYEDCTLRCQANNCRKAFHAAVIPSPPVNGEETYLCSFGIFPIGFSVKGKDGGGHFPSWSPVSTMFAYSNNKNAGKQSTAGKPAPRVFYDEDDVYVEISSDDDDWQTEEGERGRICGEKCQGVTVGM